MSASGRPGGSTFGRGDEGQERGDESRPEAGQTVEPAEGGGVDLDPERRGSGSDPVNPTGQRVVGRAEASGG